MKQRWGDQISETQRQKWLESEKCESASDQVKNRHYQRSSRKRSEGCSVADSPLRIFSVRFLLSDEHAKRCCSIAPPLSEAPWKAMLNCPSGSRFIITDSYQPCNFMVEVRKWIAPLVKAVFNSHKHIRYVLLSVMACVPNAGSQVCHQDWEKGVHYGAHTCQDTEPFSFMVPMNGSAILMECADVESTRSKATLINEGKYTAYLT